MTLPSPDALPDDAIEAIAAAWLAEREDGLDAVQASEFTRWCQAAPRHAAAVVRLEAARRLLATLPAHAEDPRRHARLDALRDAPAGPVRPIRHPPWAWGTAAALLILTLTGWWLWPKAHDFERTYTTTDEGYTRAILPDGSVLELNGNSEVRVHYAASERSLTLARGEAFFSVTKNPTRPFLVSVGKIRVRAVGTAFNVRQDSRAVEVVVTEGRVILLQLIAPATEKTKPAITPPAVSAGERALVSASADIDSTPVPTVEKISAELMRELVAWQEPRLVFRETPLAEVVAQFNRRNRLQLVLADAELAARPVAGSFRADHVESFVRLLVRGGDVSAEYPDAVTILLRRSP